MRALASASVGFGAGEFTIIMGSDPAESTMMHILAGLDAPQVASSEDTDITAPQTDTA